MNFDPHHWAYAAIDVLEEDLAPKDEKTAELVKALRDTSEKTLPIREAWKLFRREDTRIILDAFFLSGALYSAINASLGLRLDIIQAYHEYLFDMSGFQSQLDTYCYVDDVRRYINPNHALYLQTAITGGPEALQWLWSRGPKGRMKHAPTEVLETMMVENMYKALSTRHVPLNSDIARIGLEHSRTAIQAAATLQRLNPTDDQDALAELKLKLTYEDKSMNLLTEGAPRPDDILH